MHETLDMQKGECKYQLYSSMDHRIKNPKNNFVDISKKKIRHRKKIFL